jgi:hypothetical protein
VLENHHAYRAAADIYLEGFPFGSLTALMEAVLFGSCPVLALAPASRVLASDDLAFKGLLENATSEEQYLQQVEFLIHNPVERERIARQARTNIVKYHSGEGWRNVLQQVYQWLENTSHDPHRIPASSCLESDDDLSLSKFQLALCGDRPRLLDVGARTFPRITLAEMSALFSVSRRTRDTRISYSQYRSWWQDLLRPKIWRLIRQHPAVSALLRR